MKRQRIELVEYDWDVMIFYDATINDVDEIMEYLYHIHCDGVYAKRAYKNLTSGEMNTGLTFSRKGESCIVLGRATDTQNFAHTLSHEIIHLGHHIAQYFGFSSQGEQLAYLIGDITALSLPYASEYLCKCCAKKDKNNNYEND